MLWLFIRHLRIIGLCFPDLAVLWYSCALHTPTLVQHIHRFSRWLSLHEHGLEQHRTHAVSTPSEVLISLIMLSTCPRAYTLFPPRPHYSDAFMRHSSSHLILPWDESPPRCTASACFLG
ncbi:hypothetical protein GY45DRAFT_949311 [Cubamyces sp. BRFM 1775]|nr:hypothetical protein GY45DRAFT_949311 [Cubamyces sp. BRFM 1775]